MGADLHKAALRIWIAAASLLSFVVGWVVLAQSPRPPLESPLVLATPVPTLDPSILQLDPQQLPSSSASPFIAPPMRPGRLRFFTGGS